jgi:hypothetical protein
LPLVIFSAAAFGPWRRSKSLAVDGLGRGGGRVCGATVAAGRSETAWRKTAAVVAANLLGFDDRTSC